MPFWRVTRWSRVLAFGLVFHYALEARAKPVEETWDSVYLAGSKIGYVHTTVDEITEGNRKLLRIHVDTQHTIRRYGQTIELAVRYLFYESPEGELVRFDNRMRISAREIHTTGEVFGDVLRLQMHTPEKVEQKDIPWDGSVKGLYWQEQVLRRKPLRPGDAQSFRTFLPDINKLCTMTLSAGDLEDVSLLRGTRRLLRVVTTNDALPGLKTASWVDETGETLKTHTDALGGMVTYRTTREEALAKPKELPADLGLSTMVRLSKPLKNGLETREVVYRVVLSGADPADVFPSDERQRLARQPDGSYFLTVRHLKADGGLGPLNTVPEEFRTANGFVQSDNVNVVKLAREAVGDAKEPWEQALRLERWVHEQMKVEELGVGFATAAEVAETRSGDCTEHAVLLTALARAVGIPSRVAVGLLYVAQAQGFGYHMWTEVFVGGRWLPLDAVLGRGFVGGAHIKLADSSLRGVSASATFAPVLRVVGKLQLDLVSSQPAPE